MFYHDRWLKFYMYDFRYVYFYTIPEEDYLTATKKFVENYRKVQLLDQSQNISLDLVTFVQKIMS